MPSIMKHRHLKGKVSGKCFSSKENLDKSMTGGDLQASTHQHNGPVGNWDQWDKTEKLFTWSWEMKGWPLGDDKWNQSRSLRLARTAEQAEHPEHIFQASIWIQPWAAGLGDGRTRSGVESTVSKCCLAHPIMGQPGAERKDFYPGYCRSQNTFQAAAPS